jgi:hypothetical protein
MKNLILLFAFLSVCAPEPVFAGSDHLERIQPEEVIGVMSRLPPEACLYRPHGKGCDKPGGYDKGPDAVRIAEAIARHADGAISGNPELDAAIEATFSSYESGNKADAVGDAGKAKGAWQLHFADESVAFDPEQAVTWWRSIAVGTMKVGSCANNPPDERLAGLAGSCTFEPARRKVRQRVQAAREALTR